ncbi:MAG: helix-turn-helix domain-containing protein [Candidatus Magasanikbacteria bacterium]|jgi:hypothetical protein|nr:helix-turn-helix domain-containing protein [Candidatus Magasanikbacteria bacterium]
MSARRLEGASEGVWWQRCGGAFAIVPAHVLKDASLSEGARLLFAILAVHDAGGEGKAMRSNRRLAAELGVKARTVQRRFRELESARLVKRVSPVGSVGHYELLRDRARADEANESHVRDTLKRDRHATRTAVGKAFAEAKRIAAPMTPVTGGYDTGDVGTYDTGVTHRKGNGEKETSEEKKDAAAPEAPCPESLELDDDGPIARQEDGEDGNAEPCSETPEPEGRAEPPYEPHTDKRQMRLRAFGVVEGIGRAQQRRQHEQDAYSAAARKAGGWETLVALPDETQQKLYDIELKAMTA